MLNFDFIEQKAKDSQIDDITIEREYWQLLFLQRLYQSDKSEFFFFKGGTAIRFLLNSFRFSEDLDFTSSLETKSVESLLKKVFNFFSKYSPVDLELKKERVPQAFHDISICYRFLFKPRKAKQKTSIRMDISLREKPLSIRQSVITPFDYPISPYPLVTHLSKEEIMAEKVRALFVRKKPRDLFDLWFLLTKGVEIKSSYLKHKFQLYSKLDFKQSILVDIVKSFKKRELKQDLNQFLPQNYRNFYISLQDEILKLLHKLQ